MPKAVWNNLDVILCANMLMMEAAHSLGQHPSPGCTPNVLHDTLGRGLRLASVFWSHLRSFVTTMRPKHSLNHNIKSVPLVLTGNKSWQMPRAKRLKFMFLTRLLSIKMTTSEYELCATALRFCAAPSFQPTDY